MLITRVFGDTGGDSAIFSMPANKPGFAQTRASISARLALPTDSMFYCTLGHVRLDARWLAPAQIALRPLLVLVAIALPLRDAVVRL